jgi:hypothetical protein
VQPLIQIGASGAQCRKSVLVQGAWQYLSGFARRRAEGFMGVAVATAGLEAVLIPKLETGLPVRRAIWRERTPR